MSEVYAIPGERVAARVFEDEGVVINLESGAYFGLNTTATAVWGVLEGGPCAAEALADVLAGAYGVDREEAASDLRHFLAALERDGLVEATDAAATAPGALDARGPYLAPMAERYDELDELMLSGE